MGLLFFARRRKKEKEEKEKAKEGEDEKEENELDAKDNAILNEMEKAMGEDAEHEVLQLPVFTNEKSSESGSTKVDDVRAVATTGVFIKGSGSSKIKKEEEIRSTEKAVSAPRRSSWNMEDMEGSDSDENSEIFITPAVPRMNAPTATHQSSRQLPLSNGYNKRSSLNTSSTEPSKSSRRSSWNIMDLDDNNDIGEDVVSTEQTSTPSPKVSSRSSTPNIRHSQSGKMINETADLFKLAAKEERKSIRINYSSDSLVSQSMSPRSPSAGEISPGNGLALLDGLLRAEKEFEDENMAIGIDTSNRVPEIHLGIGSRTNSGAGIVLKSFSRPQGLDTPQGGSTVGTPRSGSPVTRRLVSTVAANDRLAQLKNSKY